MGWKFVRAMGNDQGYKAIKSKTLKADFRRQWAESQAKQIAKTRAYVQGHAHVDVSKGTYRSLGWLVNDQGGMSFPGAFEKLTSQIHQCVNKKS